MKWTLDAGQIEVVNPTLAAALRRKSITQCVAIILEANETMRGLIDRRPLAIQAPGLGHRADPT